MKKLVVMLTALLLVGLAACGGTHTVETPAEPDAGEAVVRAEEQAVAEVPTVIPPTASVTPVVAVTEEPTASASTPEEQLRALDEWDLVWISDSTGYGADFLYSNMVSEDVGIPVNLHKFAIGGLSAGSVLSGLRGEETEDYRLQELPEAIADAELVVFYANPTDSDSQTIPGDWMCVEKRGNYVNECALESFDVYRQHLDAIYEEILALRGDQPFIIRAYDSYNFPGKWAEDGVGAECGECWANYTQVIHDAAAAHGVPIAHVYDTFTGPNHDMDPRDQDLIGTDGVHTNKAGATLIATLVRDLGYEISSP